MTGRTDERPTYPVVEAIIDVIADWVKKSRYAAGLRGELARCGPEEVARAARDFGLSSTELVSERQLARRTVRVEVTSLALRSAASFAEENAPGNLELRGRAFGSP